MTGSSLVKLPFATQILRGGRITKWKGQVASYAPQLGFFQSVSKGAVAVALAMGGALGLPESASAQDIVVNIDSPPPFDSVLVVNNGPVSLIIKATVPVEGNEGAMEVLNELGSKDLVIEATDLLGNVDGIAARNRGTGQTVITTTGSVIGTLDDGIELTAYGTDVSINANNVAGRTTGMLIANRGTGDTLINASGLVSATSAEALDISTNGGAGDVSISVNEISGGTKGIYVARLGISTGDVTITASGDVKTTSGLASAAGIDVTVDSDLSTSNITIEATNVTSGYGIRTENFGEGGTSVTTTGIVHATSGLGIEIFQRGIDDNIIVNANEIIASDIAISAANEAGTGNVEIVAGKITTTGLSATASPATFAVTSSSNGNGDTRIQINGAIDAFGGGVYAYSGNTGRDVSVTVNDVDAQFDGLHIRNLGQGDSQVNALGTITSASDEGIVAFNDVSARNLDVRAANINAGDDGVVAENRGLGATNVEISGNIKSGFNGIFAYNYINTGNLTITAASIDAGGDGIFASNYGTGSTTVTATGLVAAASGDGFYVRNDGDSTDLVVDAVDVNAGANGIFTLNYGSGNTRITSTGDIVALGGDGIVALNGTSAVDMEVSVNNVTGSIEGIDIQNEGNGITLVRASGDVSGAASTGINIFNGSQTTGVTVTANNVSGVRADGISVLNVGQGSTFVEAIGRVSGGNNGITINNGIGTQNLDLLVNDVLGTFDGINVISNGSGATTIVANGTVSGGSNGIFALAGIFSRDLTIAANDVTGGTTGISANNFGSGSTSISIDGDVTSGFGFDAVFATNGANSGNLSIIAGNPDATITSGGGANGILALNDGLGSATTVVVRGSVAGGVGGDGIDVRAGADTGAVTVIANNVTAGDRAITVTNAGAGDTAIITNGVISAENIGIEALTTGAGATTIEATGAISGGTYGVLASNGINASSISVSVNDVTGGTDGIRAVNNGSGSTFVGSTGRVYGGGGNGISAYNYSGTTDLIISANEVRGTISGIYASSQGTGAIAITTDGPVSGRAEYAIFAINDSAGTDILVEAVDAFGGKTGIAAVNVGVGDTSITVSGTVIGNTDDGIFVATDINAANIAITAADVRGGNRGINVSNGGIGETTIAASGTVTGNASAALEVENGATATNLTIRTNNVVGADGGIIATNAGTGATAITASGVVNGGTGYGISALNSTTATDLFVAANQVTGQRYGIFALNEGTGNTVVSAAGSVLALGEYGIFAANGTNAGDLTVEAVDATGVDVGIAATNAGTGSITVVATGTISGLSDKGLLVGSNVTGANIDVSVVDVVGADGVEIENNGTGSTAFRSSGQITGLSGFGAEIYNGTASTDLIISVSDVDGLDGAVIAQNAGTGTTTVQASGALNGGLGYALDITNGTSTTALSVSLIGVAEGDSGILSRNYGTGSTTVAAAGNVVGRNGTGITARNGSSALNLTVAATDVTGGADGIFAYNSGSGSTSVTAIGTITGLNSDGLEVRNGQLASDLEVTVFEAAGNSYGINATNLGSGVTSITATGDVTGTVGNGIKASNFIYSTDISVQANNVTGGRDGIYLLNNGTGIISVTANGDIAGLNGDGIDVRNSVRSQGLNISVQSVAGEEFGILARNQGNGATTISASGSVAGVAFDGISATNFENATDLSIAVRDASGATGITAENFGSGSTTIVALGTVTGTNGYGIGAYNSQTATDLTIRAREVIGSTTGLLVQNNGTGSTSITIAGSTVGQGGDGISVTNAASAVNLDVAAASVNGATSGIVANNAGSGATNVTATGPVSGNATFGIYVANSAAGSDLSINATDVAGGTDGIRAQNNGTGATRISATGAVIGNVGVGVDIANGSNSSGIDVSLNTVTGNEYGVRAINEGDGRTTVTATGAIVADVDYGLLVANRANSSGLSISVADVSGGTGGLYALNEGSGSTLVVSNGTVTGRTGQAIYAVNGTSAEDLEVVANNAAGQEAGVLAFNQGRGSTEVSVTGTSSSETEAGVFVANTATATDIVVDVHNASGTSGIYVENVGIGTTTVSSSGAVTGTTNEGLYVYSGPNTRGLNIAVGEVAGVNQGIDANNQGVGATTVIATGLVSASSGEAVLVKNGNIATDLTVSVASVSGSSSGIFVENDGVGNTFISATGTVTGTTNQGIFAANAASADNLSITVVDVKSNGSGVIALNEGTGATVVTASGNVEAVTGAGLDVRNRATSTGLTISAHAVSSEDEAILALNYGSGATQIAATGRIVSSLLDGITVYNSALSAGLSVSANEVAAGRTGISIENRGTGDTVVRASGTVSGADGDGLNVVNFVGSSDLTISTNAVSGSDEGIYARNDGNGATSITATGSVSGTGGDGIFALNSTAATDLSLVVADVSGGDNGIVAENRGKGATQVTARGKVEGLDGAGITALNIADSSDLTISSDIVSGNTFGILARNYGTGSTNVDATGSITALLGDGLFLYNGTRTGNIAVTAGDVHGNGNGIFVISQGVGSIAIASDGAVVGTLASGIYATNSNVGSAISISAVDATGGENGILVQNNGTGITSVSATGTVSGGTGVGVGVANGPNTKGLDISVNNVAGSQYGVRAINDGTGDTTILAKGAIIADVDYGLAAFNGENAGGLAISVADVSGGTGGFYALNEGSGSTLVVSNGTVTGRSVHGIHVINGTSAEDLEISANNVAGQEVGVLAFSQGSGSTTVTVTGSVTSKAETGVYVTNTEKGTDLAVTVRDVSGGDDGIIVSNEGIGNTNLNVLGTVISKDNDGIFVANAASSRDINVQVNNVEAVESALVIRSKSTGSTTLAVAGKVAGGTGSGIRVFNTAGTTATINLAATADVGATSGSALLNDVGNSVLNVANGAVVRGTVRLGDGSDTANFALASTAAFATITALDGGDNLSGADGFVDTLNLNGAGTYDLAGSRITNWEAFNINAGTVGFSDAVVTAGALNVNAGGALNGANSLAVTANVTVAANGALLAGNAAGNSRTRIIGNLASAGLVNLSGPAGSAKAGDTLSVSGNFTGNGGQVRLDTVLGGDNAPTDLVSITGNAAGGSLLAINNTGGLGGLTTGDGIRIVQVGGTSDRDAFALLGDDLQAGGFRYDLFLGGIADPNDQDWYLRTVGASDIAATTLSFARLSDDIAMTFLGTLHERVGEQEHLAKRGYPSSGFGGLWGRFVGKGFRERLSSATLGEIKSTGSITGLQMGLDFGRSIKSDGSATFTGAYAGYADGSSNDQNIFRNVARRSGTSGSKGWLTGLYATHYGSTGWYANAVVQASWVDASASARNGVTLESDGRTYLGSVELGKSLKLGDRLAFETQAQLIYGETRFDDARDSAGIANKIRVEDSLTGRVGFRLKTTKDEKYNAAGGLFSGYLKANLWHNLLGSDVRLNTAGVDLGKFEPKKTWVDAGLGTTLTVAKNTELFFDADVEIGLDRKTAAGTGKAGLRINW